MNKVVQVLTLIFSFFLGFGKYDPFGTNGLYFDAITVVMLVSIFFSTNILKTFIRHRKNLFLLIGMGFLLFLLGVFYGSTEIEKNIFNFKYFASAIIFWFLSVSFIENKKIMYYSILLFSISCSVIALAYTFGFLNSYAEIRNGRLIIFEENPNSVSTRMAISFIISLHFIIVNPLKLKLIRLLLMVALPFLFLFIVGTSSRGSFFALGLGTLSVLYFSKISNKLKIFLAAVLLLVSISIFGFLFESTLFERLTNADLTGGREEIWKSSIQIFYDYPFGVGENGYLHQMNMRYGMTSDTHNLFLYLIISGGFISLALFIVFLLNLFKKSLHELKKGDSLFIIIFIFFCFLMSKTGGVLTYLVMWYFFAVINSSVSSKYVIYEN